MRILIVFFLLVSVCYAQTPTSNWCDADGDCLDIDSSGNLVISDSLL